MKREKKNTLNTHQSFNKNPVGAIKNILMNKSNDIFIY